MINGEQTLTNDELNRFQCHCKAMTLSGKAKQVRNGFLGLLLANTGLRIGEACKLLINDLIQGDIPVISLLVRAEITKTKKERYIPLNAAAQEAIGLMQRKIWKTTDAKALPITPRQAERVIWKIGMDATGRELHPHMLRHTFASRILKVSNIRIAQELLGHINIQSTQIYTHPDNEDLTNAVKAL